MASERRSMPGLDELQRALSGGDVEAVRRALGGLDARERQVLAARLGPGELERVTGRVRGAERGPRLGKVVVIHGIMGAQLDAVDAAGGGADRIWVSYLRLALGRIEDLKLAPDGSPANPRRRVEVAGLFPEYLPLVAELAERWDVLPFAFDWRKDVDESADRLAARIREWAPGQPVHVVAHSMGGLVARRLAQRSPDLWAAMADGTSLERGGRLVMLGTPNRGSYAIPLVLTGEEKTVRLLQALDARHGRRELLEVLATFPGSYQMLPSPAGDAADDRARLFEAETWGPLPVVPQHLARARAFHQALDGATDPGRLVYVAGFDRPTPFRIRVDGPGRFRYQETLEGDGRVPHELGLLDGVATFWVRAKHGDLARDAAVLSGIHELLQRGTTDALLRERPAVRGAPAPGWRDPAEIEGVPAGAVGPELLPGTQRGARALDPTRVEEEASRVGPEDAARVESLLVREYLGAPGAGDERADDERGPAAAGGRRERGAAPKLRVQVRWGDITRVPADVYAVGHYQGVLPQNAELALDKAISGPNASAQDLVLTRLTRRGVLRGALGDVQFFPVPTGEPKGRVVAVAGMGHPGGFGAPELRRLARNLAAAVMALPGVERVASVLVGGGTGALPVETAAEGLVLGFAEALGAGVRRSHVRELVLVELQLEKAYQLHETLEALRDELRPRVDLEVGALDLARDGGGRVSDPFCFGLTLASAAAAAAAGGDQGARGALETLLAGADELGDLGGRTLESLRNIHRKRGEPLTKIAAKIAVMLRTPRSDAGDAPTRLSFVRTGREGGAQDAIVAAALTDTVVMPERRLGADPRLVDELVQQMVQPLPASVPELSQLLAQLVIPRDFRELISRERPTVFEVDRGMAAVHWEMLACRVDGDASDGQALSLAAPVARQLRTSYSPPPTAAPPLRWPLRALVIGDPGDPREGASLPGAREEALAVRELLLAKGLKVDALIGAPSSDRAGLPAGVEPASRLGVLRKLLRGGYDLLHYAGHGGFDERDLSVAGWLFEGGLLTSRELEHVDLAPRLVVANACLSSRTSSAYASGKPAPAGRESDLLPGLADEFFRRGVRNYLGTAWEVNDDGAVLFARTFYETLFPESRAAVSIGDALLAARRALKNQEGLYGTLWAAYQHYGDPLQKVVPEDGQGDARGRSGAAEAREGLQVERAP